LPSERFRSRAAKELRKELIVAPLPELGLVAANGPNDPDPELVVEDGRVRRVHTDKGTIDTIQMERQVTLNVGEYDPLIMVKGLPSWPSEPHAPVPARRGRKTA